MNVLLATHGRSEMLRQVLACLLAGADAGGITRMVIVENGEKCGAEELIDSLDSGGLIQYMYSEPANKSLALNLGLQSCDDGLVFMTDDDVRIEADVLSAYRAAAEEYGPGHYFGGPTVAEYEADPGEKMKGLLPVSARGLSKESLVGATSFLGFNWAAFKQDMVKTGGFDPRFGPGSTTGATGQESAMQRRLLSLGCHPVPLYDAVVAHMVPSERSTPEWIISRAYKHGIESALLASETDGATLAKTGRELKYQVLKHWVGSLFFRSPYRKATYGYFRSKERGFRHGCGLCRQQQMAN